MCLSHISLHPMIPNPLLMGRYNHWFITVVKSVDIHSLIDPLRLQLHPSLAWLDPFLLAYVCTQMVMTYMPIAITGPMHVRRFSLITLLQVHLDLASPIKLPVHVYLPAPPVDINLPLPMIPNPLSMGRYNHWFITVVKYVDIYSLNPL